MAAPTPGEKLQGYLNTRDIRDVNAMGQDNLDMDDRWPSHDDEITGRTKVRFADTLEDAIERGWMQSFKRAFPNKNPWDKSIVNGMTYAQIYEMNRIDENRRKMRERYDLGTFITNLYKALGLIPEDAGESSYNGLPKPPSSPGSKEDIAKDYSNREYIANEYRKLGYDATPDDVRRDSDGSYVVYPDRLKLLKKETRTLSFPEILRTYKKETKK